jgi:hypothetical protein
LNTGGVFLSYLVIITQKTKDIFMTLQALLSDSELDMSVPQIKAFFLGMLNAQKPMNFKQAQEELLSETPEEMSKLEGELAKLWSDLEQKKLVETKNLFPASTDLNQFLADARDQLDYFLTAMSLSGTHSDSCEDEELCEIIDELEDTVMDLDEYLAEEGSAEEGEELKVFLLEAWNDFIETKKF